jgi:hypothetical protein
MLTVLICRKDVCDLYAESVTSELVSIFLGQGDVC